MKLTPIDGNPFDQVNLTPVEGNPFAVSKENKSKSPNKAIGTTRAALQGAMFGFSDEIGSAISASIFNGLQAIGAVHDDGRTFKEIFRDDMASLKEERDSFREENPKTALAAEIGGGLATGVAGLAKTGALKTAQAASPLMRTAKVAGVGATEGALFGAGTADGGLEDRAKGALKGAAIGALAAPVGSKLIDVGVKGVGAVARPIGGLFTSSRDDAVQALRKAAADEGISPQEATNRILALGDEGVISDAGPAFNQLLRSASDASSEVASKARKVVDGRQIGQQSRLKKAARIAAGKDGADYANEVNSLLAARAERAGPLYDEAFATPIERSPALESIIDRLGSNMRKGMALAKREGLDVKDNLMQTLHYAKMSLDNDIGRKMRAGEKVEARVLLKLKDDLLTEINEINPAYNRAMQEFAGDTQVIEAAKLGRKVLTENIDDLRVSVNQMTSSELDSFRLGAVKAFEDKLDTIRQNTNANNRFFSTDAGRERLRLAFGDNFEDVVRAANKEEAFSTTRGVLGGSQTSKNLRAGAEAADNLSLVGKLTSGNITGGVLDGLSRMLRLNKETPQFYKELGDLMLDQGMTPSQIRDIFRSEPVIDALGASYDDVVLPYIRGLTAIPVSVSAANN